MVQFIKHALGTTAIVVVGLVIINKVAALSTVRTYVGLTG